MNPYFKTIQKLLLASTIVLLAGCSVLPKPKLQIDGAIGGKLLFSKSSSEMRKLMKSFGVAGVDNMQIYGIKAYKISYVTRDGDNRKVRASGLLTIPQKTGSKGVVSYHHGTITLNSKCPTVWAGATRKPSLPSVAFSSIEGFVTLEADYIGYGDSQNHYHPYMLRKPLANATVDFIRTARRFAKENKIRLNRQLFLTGFSEGGYVTMATLRRLKKLNIPVTAAAPMAGAYDLDYMAKEVLSKRKKSLSSYSMTYTILTLNAYAKHYHKTIDNIMREPYGVEIKKLLDGNHSFAQIDSTLPVNEIGKNGLLKQSFLDRYARDKNFWFTKALKENSLHHWNPQGTLKLIHCQGDDQVPYTISVNTQKSINRYKKRSNAVMLITPDAQQKPDKKWGHNACFLPSIVYVSNWFMEISENQ